MRESKGTATEVPGVQVPGAAEDAGFPGARGEDPGVRVSRSASGKPEARAAAGLAVRALGRDDAVLLDALVESAAREPEHLGRRCHRSPLFAEHGLDVAPLRF